MPALKIPYINEAKAIIGIQYDLYANQESRTKKSRIKILEPGVKIKKVKISKLKNALLTWFLTLGS